MRKVLAHVYKSVLKVLHKETMEDSHLKFFWKLKHDGLGMCVRLEEKDMDRSDRTQRLGKNPQLYKWRVFFPLYLFL